MIKFIRSLLNRNPNSLPIETNLLIEALDKDKFQRWLESQNPFDSAGFPYVRSQCPIAKFLRSQGFHDVGVGSSSVLASTETKTYHLNSKTLPAWVTSFVLSIDGLPSDLKIPVFKALEVLQKL